jgi:hypothetical protein
MTSTQKFTAAIEILIERMKTHPEEFYRASRWCNLVSDFDRFLTPEDRKAFEDGVAECRRAELTEIVLDRLTTETLEDKEALDKLVRPPNHGGNPYTQRVLYNADTDQYYSQLSQYQQAQNSALNQLAGQQSTQLQGTTVQHALGFGNLGTGLPPIKFNEDVTKNDLMQSFKKLFK